MWASSLLVHSFSVSYCCCWNISFSVGSSFSVAFRFRYSATEIAFVFDFNRIGKSMYMCAFVFFSFSIWFLSWLVSSSISFIDQGHRHFVNDLSTLILMTLFVVIVVGAHHDDDGGVVLLLLSHTHLYGMYFGCHFFHIKYGSLKATA